MARCLLTVVPRTHFDGGTFIYLILGGVQQVCLTPCGNYATPPFHVSLLNYLMRSNLWNGLSTTGE